MFINLLQGAYCCLIFACSYYFKLLVLRVYKSNSFPEGKRKFFALQDYATEYYGLLFFILVLILMYQMGTGRSILYTGLIGSLLMLSFANFLAAVRMKRRIVAMAFEDDLFYPINAFDHVFGQKTKSFPIVYASPKRTKAGLEIVYRDSIILLKREEWPNLEEVYQDFFPKSPFNTTIA